MKKILYLLTVTTFATISNVALALGPLNICNDVAEWPPYVFADESGKVVGVSTEVLEEIFRRHNVEATIKLLPWKRCLENVKRGKADMVYDASLNEERAATYLISKPMYTIKHGFFYKTNKYPNPPSISTAADVDKFKVAGVRGYNFDYTFDTSQIYSNLKDIQSLVQYINSDRADLAIGYVEIFKGFKKLGRLELEGFDSVEIPESNPLVFHAMISRQTNTGPELLNLINTGLEELEADGTLQKIFAKYGI